MPNNLLRLEFVSDIPLWNASRRGSQKLGDFNAPSTLYDSLRLTYRALAKHHSSSLLLCEVRTATIRVVFQQLRTTDKPVKGLSKAGLLQTVIP